MTDRAKVNQAIAVLEALEQRIGHGTYAGAEIIRNLGDLRKLLTKKHETDTNRGKYRTLQSISLAVKLLEHIRKRKKNFREPNINQWAVDMQDILRLDKRTPEQLEDVIDWCQHDEFWKNNILSPAKLRRQLDRLEMAMERDSKWKRNRSVRPPEGKTAKDKYLESLEKTNG